jgi:P27 family predicted phage terminase small subunit
VKRGTKPKSTAQRKLAGNPGRRPLNQNEPVHPQPSSSFEAVPPQLTGDAAAEWTRLAPMLRRARQITEADRGALMALCIEWARYLEATMKTQTLGLVVKAPISGFPMMNPYLPIATKALAMCNRLWPELGLTPSSRSRVQADGPGPEGDAFSEFDQLPGFDDRKH